MPNLLLAWVGRTDLQASVGVPEAGLGPIGQAVTQRSFDEIVLISDFDKKKSANCQSFTSTKARTPLL